MKAYIEVGQIVKPQGIKGEVKVIPLTDDPMRFEGENTFYFEENGAYAPVTARFSRFDGQAVYLFIDGVNDRNAAEKLRGRYLLVDRAHAAKLNDGEYFIVDLIGIKGLDETGKGYGILKEVMQPGGNDVYVFVDKAARKEYLIPALKSVVISTDPEKGEMVFDSKRLNEVSVINDI
ncbi:MAG: 16S rRNA processing protein RimM [Clostridia bacterium]|nr:16S rRNA processing protein RimM [Clostridia bacterium]